MAYKLFIGHLDQRTRTVDLEDFFKDNGFDKSIEEVVVKQGYGFVRMDDRRDADDAIYELNGKELDGSRIQVEMAKSSGGGGGGGRGGGYSRGRDRYDDRRGGRDDRRGGGGGRFGRPYNTEHRVIVDNVSSTASWQDLKDLFRKAGEVTFAKCHQERQGEGVVEFATSSDMRNAMKKMDGEEFYGKRLKLHCPSMGSRSRSRSRSRSPRRSRSRSRSRSRGRRNRSRSRSPRRSRSRSKSRSKSRSRSKSPAPAADKRSASPERQRSASRSPSPR